jgi:hypothetical protein
MRPKSKSTEWPVSSNKPLISQFGQVSLTEWRVLTNRRGQAGEPPTKTDHEQKVMFLRPDPVARAFGIHPARSQTSFEMSDSSERH